MNEPPFTAEGSEESEPQPRRQWALAVVAIVVALAVVGTFTYLRLGPRPAPAGRPAGSLAMAVALDFTCNLPVTAYSAAATVSLPGGQVTIDSVSAGGGKGGLYSYSYAGGRWLPVQSQWISPDGRSYGFATTTTGAPGRPMSSAVYVHDIASGKDRQLWAGGGNATMVGFGAGGVYFLRQAESPASALAYPELWAVDPARPAAAHRVGPNPPPAPPIPGQPFTYFGPGQVAGGGAWSAILGAPPEPPQPGQAYPPKGPDSVVRMDLKDGTLSTWYRAPAGKSVGILGFDAQGHPILTELTLPAKPVLANATPDPALMFPPPPATLLLTGPDQVVRLSDGSNPDFRPVTVSGDSHGIWFGVPGSLWLYRKGGLQKVADVPAGLFPQPTPYPGGVQGKTGLTPPSPPPGYPQGALVRVAGACA